MHARSKYFWIWVWFSLERVHLHTSKGKVSCYTILTKIESKGSVSAIFLQVPFVWASVLQWWQHMSHSVCFSIVSTLYFLNPGLPWLHFKYALDWKSALPCWFWPYSPVWFFNHNCKLCIGTSYRACSSNIETQGPSYM